MTIFVIESIATLSRKLNDSIVSGASILGGAAVGFVAKVYAEITFLWAMEVEAPTRKRA